jgi:hypothetical protein
LINTLLPSTWIQPLSLKSSSVSVTDSRDDPTELGQFLLSQSASWLGTRPSP